MQAMAASHSPSAWHTRRSSSCTYAHHGSETLEPRQVDVNGLGPLTASLVVG